MPRIDRYQNPELYETLAGEYVLGTMNSRARRRFAQLMDERPYIREAVEAWDRRLHPLAERLVPVQPRQRVWYGIRDEIRSDQRQRHAETKKPGWVRSLVMWRSFAVFASLLSAFLVSYEILKSPTVSEMPSYVAVLESDKRIPMFVATAIPQPMHMVIKMMDESTMYPDKDLELWCFVKDSNRAWSMGVLQRSRETVLLLDQQSWDMVNESTSLAISAEPMGGSPTGRPTGPIMYSGDFVSLI